MSEESENKGKPGHGKRILLRTFGCQMNERDSEIVTGLLLESGFGKAVSADEADVVLFNTCSVRRHAEERGISNMGLLLKHAAHNPQSTIHNPRSKTKIYGIIGCTAQALKRDLFRRLPGLDIVCGTGEIHRLPEFIKQAQESRVLACGGMDKDIPELPSHYRENGKKGYVSIMRGCDNFCSYCIVPHVRGHERSRRPENIVREVKDLAERGIKDITLLGQNVNSYNGLAHSLERISSSERKPSTIHNPLSTKTCNFVQLLRLINKIDGIENIRFMTSHPKDATSELFGAIRDLEKVSKELHLPLQSGSDRILRLMNRGYTAGKYRDLVKQLRHTAGDCKITTDIIVGFPSETDNDFSDTYKMVKAIGFNAAYIFKYSPRPPAKSADLGDSVPKETKEKRHRSLLDLQKAISKKKRLKKNN